MIKTFLKNVVGRTAHNPGAWYAYRMCGGASRFLGNIYGHARFVREAWERDEALTRIAAELFPSLMVATGPFQGMRYPNLRSVGSALLPKLLGSYESELHPILNVLLTCDYSSVVDVGCAEGYYAVGLAMRLKHANVYAFDTDSRARDVCKDMAALNGVAERTHIGTFCDKETLRSLKLGPRALIVADCEGYETELFDEKIAQFLGGHDLIVEAHDFIDINISKTIYDTFRNTHKICSVKSVDDIQKAHTYRYEQLDRFSLAEKRLVLSERRPAIMEWLVMTSLASTSKDVSLA